MAWESLIAVYRQAAEDRRQLDQQPPLACPNDGEPLQPGPQGQLHCPAGDYEYPRDRRAYG
jgi:hypothetical protein